MENVGGKMIMIKVVLVLLYNLLKKLKEIDDSPRILLRLYR